MNPVNRSYLRCAKDEGKSKMKETTPKKSIATEVENTAAQHGGANKDGNLNHKCRKCLHVTYTSLE